MTRYQFTAMLKKALEFAGIPCQLYTSHSFRIGSASTATMLGLQEEYIKHLGRWKSNAVRAYIR